jgi:hypothetical protein
VLVFGLGAGVDGGADGGQALGGDTGVDLGGVEIPVAEQLLDVSDVGPVLDLYLVELISSTRVRSI